jgi:hypothetical protein
VAVVLLAGTAAAVHCLVNCCLLSVAYVICRAVLSTRWWRLSSSLAARRTTAPRQRHAASTTTRRGAATDVTV